MIIWELLGASLAATIAVWIYSFLYKDNVAYAIAEHMFIGVAAGYSIGLAIDSLRKTLFIPLSRGDLFLLIPLLLGLSLFFKYSKKYYWIARYGSAVTIAAGAAVAMRTAPTAQIIKQVNSVIVPLWIPHDPISMFNNWLIVLIVIGGLLYFIFTIFPKTQETSKPSLTGRVYVLFCKIGVYGMMVAFGALFANAIMGRLTYFVTVVLQYLQPQPIACFIAMILAIIAIAYEVKK